MNNPKFDYIGEKLPRLGFGLMRLPVLKNGEIDVAHTQKMVDYYMESGMNYFDTAYPYHDGKSEEVLGETVVKKYSRDSYKVASKLPIWELHKKEDNQRIFDEQIRRTGLEYFDYYMLHAMDKERDETCTKLGSYDFMKGLKAQGKAKHIGFSYHGDAATMRKILTEHPEMEFAQLQINYYDWDSIEAQELYDIAIEFQTPIIIMEPVRGGVLSHLPEQVERILTNQDPKASPASWALRYCASLDGLMTVLSGMSNLDQMKENVEILGGGFQPLTEKEQEVLARAAEALQNIPTIPCTSCKYCVDCPQSIPIFDVLGMYNDYVSDGQKIFEFRQSYDKLEKGKRAEDCIDCGLCTSHCPQSIPIPRRLGEIAALIG